MAKARVVISDQNSAEFDELRRSYNSLLLILENICAEVTATTLTAAQGFEALDAALSTGVDSSGTPSPHVGTGRQLVGLKGSPVRPLRKAEDATKLVEMAAADKY